MNKLELNDVIRNNRLLTSDYLNKNLDNLHIERRDKDDLHFKLNLVTINELIYSNPKSLQENLSNYSRFIRSLFEKDHLMLVSDIDRLEKYPLNPVIAFLPLWDTALSTRVTNVLMNKRNIYFVGDLINTDYQIILNTTGLGEVGCVEIKKYIHSIGYKLPNETLSTSEIIEKQKEKGITVLEDEYSIDKRLLKVFYENFIYTKNDFLSYGFNIFSLNGLTTITRGLLIEFMQENHLINIANDSSISDIKDSFDGMNNQIDVLNNQIKQRIKTKEILLEEYNAKVKEKQELIEKEKLLDEQLKTIISEFNEVFKDKGLGDKGVRK